MSKPTLSEVIDHIRNRTYMGGVERDQLRVKATGEVFTPTELVREMLEQIPIEQFQDPTKTFLDNSCGDGQFLGEVLIRKMENGSTFEQALRTIYGVDLMPDNVDLCRERLLCGQEHLRHIVERNIVCHDALTYDYSFNGTNFTEKELLDQILFEFT
jgi:type I restriction-modification system DNA methylase subunit